MAELIDVCRDALRRKSTALDETEIIPLIEAAKIDLYAAGVASIEDNDPMVQAVIRLYVLATVERDNNLMAFYIRTKNGMALNRYYNGG